MVLKQHTISSAASVSGKGLHTGVQSTLTFLPAPIHHGLVFQRTDLPEEPMIRALAEFVTDTSRGTTLTQNGASVQTVEHVLAALSGLCIDNCIIQLDGPEPPIMDGSSRAFVDCLKAAGLEEQDAPREYFIVEEPIYFQDAAKGIDLVITPSSHFSATVTVDYQSTVLPVQQAHISQMEQFDHEIADSRTFVFLHELEALHAAGLIKGGSLNSAVVVVEQMPDAAQKERLKSLFPDFSGEVSTGILNEPKLRTQNEPARHKLLDLVGDLTLAGLPIKGHVIANKPGHHANVELAKKVQAKIKQKKIQERFQKVNRTGIVFDINAIQDILPHRYPFLLVDKIISFTENTITGIKNVTFNEQFFQGHFPGNPVMPGVLQLEAMAQVGGILLLNTIEDPKSIWVYYAAIDNARFKKPVIPGDVLVLELEMTALRRSICKMTGRALVDGQVVCSADLTASVVPKT